MTTRLPALPLAALASILLLAGCAAPSAPVDQSTDNPVVTESPAPGAGGGDVCDVLEAAGATGASIGPFDITASKEDMSAAVDEQLAILSAIQPPEEFYEPWNHQLQYAIEFKFAVDQLPEGGTFGADAMPPADPGEHGFWSDFWFDTCG